jgi:hypothetical protein
MALLLSADKLREFDKNMNAARIGEIGHVLAVQIRAVRMHEDARAQILNPEVVFSFLAVPERSDARLGRLLGLPTGEQPGALISFAGENARAQVVPGSSPLGQ